MGRFLEYADGSAMYDGTFDDTAGTPVGAVLPGGTSTQLITQDSAGATKTRPDSRFGGHKFPAV